MAAATRNKRTRMPTSIISRWSESRTVIMTVLVVG
jgi:hypothetical protein